MFRLLIVGLILASHHVNGDLSDFRLIKVSPESESHLELLNRLDQQDDQVNILNELSLNLPNYLYASSQSYEKVLERLEASGIHHEVVSSNIQNLIDEEQRQINERKLFYAIANPLYDLKNYHTIIGIQTILDKFAKDYPDIVKLTTIGKSYESRDIQMIILSREGSSYNQTAQKQIVFLECGMHAREWISPATCLHIINDILTKNSRFLDIFDFHVAPLMNPDGYVTTWTFNRLWRKNMRPSADSWCIGVDLNRNFASGYYDAPDAHGCSEIYHGKGPFSEPETVALRDHLMKYNDRLAFYFSLHSYSQMWMHPYGYKSSSPENIELVADLTKVAAKALQQTTGTNYTFGQIYQVIYPAFGSSVDWAFDETSTKISFAIELRDTGTFGFLLPPDQIEPAASEIWYAMRQVLSRYHLLSPKWVGKRAFIDSWSSIDDFKMDIE
ncbi:carboxypeptidase B-like [Brevipalpus obovatus]|uniref:carboxypeptidase B-like n=1 Tax=Brevipalpus obovatus TaxID=246614 RepID=UPI003D9EEECF